MNKYLTWFPEHGETSDSAEEREDVQATAADESRAEEYFHRGDYPCHMVVAVQCADGVVTTFDVHVEVTPTFIAVERREALASHRVQP